MRPSLMNHKLPLKLCKNNRWHPPRLYLGHGYSWFKQMSCQMDWNNTWLCLHVDAKTMTEIRNLQDYENL